MDRKVELEKMRQDSEKMNLSVEQLKLQLQIGSSRQTDSNSAKAYKTGCLLPTDGRILLYTFSSANSALCHNPKPAQPDSTEELYTLVGTISRYC